MASPKHTKCHPGAGKEASPYDGGIAGSLPADLIYAWPPVDACDLLHMLPHGKHNVRAPTRNRAAFAQQLMRDNHHETDSAVKWDVAGSGT
jgi:hypothetical protein